MKVDMSPEAVTVRLRTLNELWLLSVKLLNSKKVKSEKDKSFSAKIGADESDSEVKKGRI